MHIIVGLDTGKTSAAVCLGLDRRLLFATHMTFAGAEWLINSVGEVGVPSIIARDREPNDVARKVCTAFNARLFWPDKEITLVEKRAMAKPFGITNPHERDACSAAIKAYNAYSNKLKQAEHLARSMNVKDVDDVMAKVIEKYSINEAIAGKPANRR